MKSSLFLSLLGAASLAILPASSPAQDTDNAALLYWRAIIAANPLDTHQRAVVTKKSSDPLDEAAAESITLQWKYSLETVKQAAEKPVCNWGLDLEEGPGMRLPHLIRLQEFAQVLRLRARLRLQHGDIDGATDDLVTMLRFSRHAGEPAILIGWLVQNTIRGLAMHAVADNLPKFSDAALSRLSETLKTLPSGYTMPELIRSEKHTLADWLGRQVQQSLHKHETAEQAAWFQGIIHPIEIMGPADDSAIRHASMGEVAQAVSTLPQDYDELIRLMETPDPQSRPALHEFMERVRTGQTASSISATVLPAFEHLAVKVSEYEATRAMLLAAIDARLLHGGRGALAQSHDPYNNGAPFTMREVENGLELQSGLMLVRDGGKPATLRCAW